MSCLSALPAQIITFLSVPQDILLLRHRVFREYARIAVGPDFIHTFPSLIVFTAMCLVLWKNPPRFKCLSIVGHTPLVYKFVQICCSWIAVNAALWLWLIFQRVIYCSIWSYWSNESEYREVTLPWWQKVWSTFYPTPLQAPVLSAGFISWIVSMLLAAGTLCCALSADRVGTIVDTLSGRVQEFFESWDLDWNFISQKLVESISTNEKVGEAEENSEISSVCDDCRSEISTEAVNTQITMQKREVHPISYGTNWTPRPKFSSSYEIDKEPRRKASMQSLRTTATVAGVVESSEREQIKYSPRQLRNRRGCHTVIPNYSSDKSSGC